MLERKDDSGRKDAAPVDTKAAITDLMTAFEEFKSSNDSRLKEIEKKGSADILTEDKVERINSILDTYEGVSQKAALADANKKALDAATEQLDRLETALKRTRSGNDDVDTKSRAEDWARAVVALNIVGANNLTDAQRKAIDTVTAEYKALNVSVATAGGVLAPSEYVREITKGVTEISPVRSLARVRTTSQKALDVPKRTGQFAARWTAENGTKTETQGLAYGLDEIPTHEFYALIDISNQMLEDSVFNMQAEISTEAAEQFAVAEGAAFVSGDGVGKPLGFLAAAGVQTNNSGTAATIADSEGQANGLLTLKHALKTAYTANANWLLNRTTLGSVRKLKDGDKNYIWMPGLAAGKPNTIDGDPYVEVPDMPNEGAGLKPIAYGDFRRAYTWVDRIIMEMLRDPYTQATSGNVRFIMRKRVGGQVVLAEAIRTLTCATL